VQVSKKVSAKFRPNFVNFGNFGVAEIFLMLKLKTLPRQIITIRLFLLFFYLSQSSLLQVKQKREQNSHQRSDDAKINPVVLSSHT